ncbi:hypothetical protein ACVW1A_005961 [Bradyrhizobium sp. LB1.3]
MRFIRALAVLLFCAGPSVAAEKAESFFKKQIDNTWAVHGTSYPLNSGKPPACFANTTLPDGSLAQLTVHPSWFGDKREPHPQGSKLIIRNMQWSILAKTGKRVAHMNLYNGRTGVREIDALFAAEDKNTIVIADISRDFFATVSRSDRIILTLRDDDATIVLTFMHSQELIKGLYDCSWKYESLYNE